MIFIFDLDDTIYRERDFFINGIKAISKKFSKKLKKKSILIHNQILKDVKKNGRKKFLDRFLKKNNIYSKKNLRNALKIFRFNDLKLNPYIDFLTFLSNIKNEKKYIVTDGHKIVQKKKISSLGIKKYFDKILISRNYKISFEKPSLFCFKKIKKLQNCKWKNMIYIADNPNKDFVNLNKAGCNTVRIVRGNYKKILPQNKNFEAKYKFTSMNQKFTKLMLSYAKKN